MRKPTLALALLLAACGGSDTSSLPDCPAAPARFTGAVGLPPRFPIPDGVVVTDSRSAGPSTVVDGHSPAGIPSLYEEWRAALDRDPYSVLKSEREERDAEVNFSGEDTTGQVRLDAACEGRTSVRITARPR